MNHLSFLGADIEREYVVNIFFLYFFHLFMTRIDQNKAKKGPKKANRAKTSKES